MEYPKLKPLPIKTKGKSWYKKILIWLTESRKWEIIEDYYLFIPWLNITLKIPKGFVFDGASIPRLFWPLLSPTGILFIPGLFHDFGYKYGTYITKNNILINGPLKKEDFDLNFRLMAVWINEMPILDKIAWLALKIGGFGAWLKHRKEDFKNIKELQNLLT